LIVRRVLLNRMGKGEVLERTKSVLTSPFVGWAPYANKDYGWNQGNAYLYYDDADLVDSKSLSIAEGKGSGESTLSLIRAMAISISE
jgi:hypothetical protein